MQPRDVTPADLEDIHALNAAAVPAVSDIAVADFAWFMEHAAFFRLVEVDGRAAGFLLALEEGAPYTSINYTWFRDRYTSFCYVDRLAVGAAWRRRGIASALYADLELHARRAGARRLACEINVRPYNAESLAFHGRLGFAEVGRQDNDGGRKTVALMVRRLDDNGAA